MIHAFKDIGWLLPFITERSKGVCCGRRTLIANLLSIPKRRIAVRKGLVLRTVAFGFSSAIRHIGLSIPFPLIPWTHKETPHLIVKGWGARWCCRLYIHISENILRRKRTSLSINLLELKVPHMQPSDSYQETRLSDHWIFVSPSSSFKLSVSFQNVKIPSPAFESMLLRISSSFSGLR
jgi:hypothetical protein